MRMITGIQMKPHSLKDAQSNIFSQVDEVINYNSHSIVIAKVLAAQSADSFNGLIYADGGYLS